MSRYDKATELYKSKIYEHKHRPLPESPTLFQQEVTTHITARKNMKIAQTA